MSKLTSSSSQLGFRVVDEATSPDARVTSETRRLVHYDQPED